MQRGATVGHGAFNRADKSLRKGRQTGPICTVIHLNTTPGKSGGRRVSGFGEAGRGKKISTTTERGTELRVPPKKIAYKGRIGGQGGEKGWVWFSGKGVSKVTSSAAPEGQGFNTPGFKEERAKTRTCVSKGFRNGSGSRQGGAKSNVQK